jgi:hypothetical protein
MPSQDTFFKVKTGLSVGADTLYADVASEKVSIGKTTAQYQLDVDGTVRAETNLLADNRVGVGTTNPLERLDVRGTGIFSDSVGIGTTLPVQTFQVNPTTANPVVVTGVGSVGINIAYPIQRFQVVGTASTEVVVISGVGSVGIGTVNPKEDFHLVSRGNQRNIVITKSGRLGVNTLSPQYDVDILGDLRVTGLATINQSYTGIATIGIASISQERVAISTISLANIENELVGISTIGIASITQAYIGFATINQSYTGIATIGIASITNERVGISTVERAIIENEIVGISTINNLFVTGITTTALLDVGVEGTILKAGNFGITTETTFVSGRYDASGKEIIPLIGINTTTPTRALDVNGDIRIRGEVIDAQNNVGFGYSVLASDGIGKLIWNPPGARIGNEWFVNKLGNDENKGRSPGDAFLTIKKACSVAQPGDTIRIFAGLYTEDGPIQVPERVAVVGEDLRRTLVTTSGQTDLYHVRRGCYIAQQSFVGPSNSSAMVSFPTRGYGYADGTEENWQSPYVQNCTNFVPNSVGMRVDGNRAGGFKSMVLDAYTQYNQGGIGVSITNFGYAQLVSLFTICCDTAVFCDSGGVCDLNNSNSSFGNFGLVSNGATPLQYTGTVVSAPTGDNVDSLIINVGIGASSEFRDSVELLRQNKDFIAAEVVGFITSTDGPFGGLGTAFDYGGSPVGREKCKRDSQIIIESICSDLLTLGNINSIETGFGYRDSADGSLTYLPETSPPPTGFSTGYVKTAEIASINYIAEISPRIIQNIGVLTSYQSGVGSFAQYTDFSKTYSSNADSFIASRAGIITSIIGIGTTAAPERILPKGQRPYDGQIAYIDTQYYFVREIVIDNPGSGYSSESPVEVTIDLPPNSEFFIPAEAAIFETNIGAGGTITGIDILVSGTGYSETPPAVTIAPPPGAGVTATAHAVMEKYFFNPVSSTPVSAGGQTTVTFDEFITYPVSAGATVYFYQSSKIIASSITFEYVGTGINIVNAIPSKGAVPIVENQIVATNGGKVPFTSTDQGGNFRISEGITINQNTGTISGQAFSKSLQAEVTPLIIALQS